MEYQKRQPVEYGTTNIVFLYQRKDQISCDGNICRD